MTDAPALTDTYTTITNIVSVPTTLTAHSIACVETQSFKDLPPTSPEWDTIRAYWTNTAFFEVAGGTALFAIHDGLGKPDDINIDHLWEKHVCLVRRAIVGQEVKFQNTLNALADSSRDRRELGCSISQEEKKRLTRLVKRTPSVRASARKAVGRLAAGHYIRTEMCRLISLVRKSLADGDEKSSKGEKRSRSEDESDDAGPASKFPNVKPCNRADVQ